MTETPKYQSRIELLQGTLDMLVLQTLLREPMHGYVIAQVIRSRSGEVFTVETGSLYHRGWEIGRAEAERHFWANVFCAGIAIVTSS
jgi:Transcriptional regulator PadR-like family